MRITISALFAAAALLLDIIPGGILVVGLGGSAAFAQMDPMLGDELQPPPLPTSGSALGPPANPIAGTEFKLHGPGNALDVSAALASLRNAAKRCDKNDWERYSNRISEIMRRITDASSWIASNPEDTYDIQLIDYLRFRLKFPEPCEPGKEYMIASSAPPAACSAGTPGPACTQSDTPLVPSLGLAIPLLGPGFKVATDSNKFCTYGDGVGTPTSPAGIPSSPDAPSQPATTSGPPTQAGPGGTPVADGGPRTAPPRPTQGPTTHHGGPGSVAGPLPKPVATSGSPTQAAGGTQVADGGGPRTAPPPPTQEPTTHHGGPGSVAGPLPKPVATTSGSPTQTTPGGPQVADGGGPRTAPPRPTQEPTIHHGGPGSAAGPLPTPVATTSGPPTQATPGGPQVAHGSVTGTRQPPPRSTPPPVTHHGGPESVAGPLPQPTASSTPPCEHCGMDQPAGQPAGAPCTICNDGKPTATSVPSPDCIVCGESWPAGVAHTDDCPSCGMDGGMRSSTPGCEHCGMERPAGLPAAAPCTVCGEQPAASAPPITPATSTPPASTPTAISQTPSAAPAPTTQTPTTTTQPPSNSTPTPASPPVQDAGAPREIVITIHFKANLAALQAGQTAIAPTLEGQLGKVLTAEPPLPAAPGTARSRTAQNAGAADDPAACKAGPGGSCQVKVSVPSPAAPAVSPPTKAYDVKGQPVARPEAYTIYRDASGRRFTFNPDGTVSWMRSEADGGPKETPSASPWTRAYDVKGQPVTSPQTYTVYRDASGRRFTYNPDGTVSWIRSEADGGPKETPFVSPSTRAYDVKGQPVTSPQAYTIYRDASGRRFTFNPDGTVSWIRSEADGGPKETPFVSPATTAYDVKGQPVEKPEAYTVYRDANGRRFTLNPDNTVSWIRSEADGGPPENPATPQSAGTIQSAPLKASVDVPVSQTSGGVLETTGMGASPNLTLPAGTPAGAAVAATPFVAAGGRTYLRLSFSQPFGSSFDFVQHFQQVFGAKFKIDFCFDEAPMGAHAIASAVLDAELPSAAITLRKSAHPGRSRMR